MPDPSPYAWTVETTENEIVKKGEHQGTPGATDWLFQHFIGENSHFGLEVEWLLACRCRC